MDEADKSSIMQVSVISDEWNILIFSSDKNLHNLFSTFQSDWLSRFSSRLIKIKLNSARLAFHIIIISEIKQVDHNDDEKKKAQN